MSEIRLPPLELECMKVLWMAPGATVAQVRSALRRPLAYTTVMTVLERMTAKGVIVRRKRGRAYVYSPVFDLDSARTQAVERLLTNFFDNDREALARYVIAGPPSAEARRQKSPRTPRMDETLL